MSGLLWSIILWQSYLGWWWWVGSGASPTKGGVEYWRERRRARRGARKARRVAEVNGVPVSLSGRKNSEAGPWWVLLRSRHATARHPVAS